MCFSGCIVHEKNWFLNLSSLWLVYWYIYTGGERSSARMQEGWPTDSGRYQQQKSSSNHAPRDPFHRVCSTDTMLNFLCSGSPPKIPVLRRQDRTALAMYPDGHVTCPTRATSSQGDREEGECADENHLCSPQTGHHRQSQQLEIIKIQESMPLRIPSKDKIDSFLW